MPPNPSSKMISVFCDGTGMDGLRSEGLPRFSQGADAMTSEGDIQRDILQGVDDNALMTSTTEDQDSAPFDTTADAPTMELAGRPTNLEGGDSAQQYATNVLRLSRAVKASTASNTMKQIVLYQSGVGSQADFNGNEVAGDTIRQALGTAVASKIRDAYAFIAQNYEDGDEICIFGFSRGAYAARKVAALIYRIGLLKRIHLGYFFEIWRQLMDNETPNIPFDTPRPQIKCVGVWDTVGAVLNTINALNIDDKFLPPNVEIALHAVSIQENRKQFLPVLWNIPSPLPQGQIVKQIWFPGAHSDVGGGYQQHEVSDVALFWMAGEIKAFVNLDLDMLMASRQHNPSAWGAGQPHNAYKETPLKLRIARIITPKTRLENGDITATDFFHESVKYAPSQIQPDADYMITFDKIREHFGADFTPTYPQLNDFEIQVQRNWGSGIEGGAIVYEHISQLFGNP